MPKRRHLLIAVIAVIVTIGGYWLLRPRPIPVETATAVAQKFVVYVDVDGRTRVRDRYVVSAPLSGRVARSTWDAGDAVQAGQELTAIAPNISPLLDDRVREELRERVGAAEAAVNEAAALVERAKAALRLSEAELDRARLLHERGVTTPAKLERDEFAAQAATRELAAAVEHHDAAEHQLKQARAALKRSGENGSNEGLPVTSPVDGRILKVVQESEGAVSIGAALFEVGDPHNLEVVADVLTTDAARIRLGAHVVFENWGGGELLDGRVRRIEPSGFTKLSALGVEEQRVWVIADITSRPESWVTLSDGYRIDLKIVTDVLESAITVPVGALFRRGEEWYVFVVASGYAQLRNVGDITRSGRMAAIGKGLLAGEVVVVYPSGNLSDGGRVQSTTGSGT